MAESVQEAKTSDSQSSGLTTPREGRQVMDDTICCLTLEQSPPKKSSSFMIICNSSRSYGSGGCHRHCVVYEGFPNTQILRATHTWLSPVYYAMSVKETKVHTTMHVRAQI